MIYPKNCDVTELIVLLAKMYKPKRYLEIGTQKGYTFCKVAPLVEEAHAVDVQIQKAVSRVATECWPMRSAEFYYKYDHTQGLFDMIFVDGDHSFDAVVADIEYTLELLTTGTGLLLVHDTYPITRRLECKDRCGEAWKAVHEFRIFKSQNAEVLTLPGPSYGLTILRKIGMRHHFGITREEG